MIDVLDTFGLKRRFTRIISDSTDSHDRLLVVAVVGDRVDHADDELSVSISNGEHGVDGHDANEPSRSGSICGCVRRTRIGDRDDGRSILVVLNMKKIVFNSGNLFPLSLFSLPQRRERHVKMTRTRSLTFRLRSEV